MEIIVTGSAGFIGFSLCKKLLERNIYVIGIDNINSYYDIKLKKARNKVLRDISKVSAGEYKFFEGDITNNIFLQKIFNDFKPKYVINLAAQAGVRYSIDNPRSYIDSNIVGFLNILECCKQFNIKNLLFASSSSVYGSNKKVPFAEKDPVNHPISIYAATKRSNELMAHVYSHLYNIPSTGLRFFTVYGPWGRPDMAPIIFTNAIINKKPINIFNNGNMSRDFTFIDDVVESIIRLIKKPAKPNNSLNQNMQNVSSSYVPFQILNVGNSNPINLMSFIESLEKEIGIKAIKRYKEMEPGDVENTFADTKLIEKMTGFKPKTTVAYGVKEFISWYRKFYKV